MLPFNIPLNASSTSGCPDDSSLAKEKEAAMVLVGINIVASILGTLGNLFVCITVCTTRGMVSSFHYFIVSLAAADLMVALLDQPLLVSMIFAHVKFKCIPVVDKMCRAIGNFACAVSLLTLALIALDRCLFVLPSINYKNTMTTGKKNSFSSGVDFSWWIRCSKAHYEQNGHILSYCRRVWRLLRRDDSMLHCSLLPSLQTTRISQRVTCTLWDNRASRITGKQSPRKYFRAAFCSHDRYGFVGFHGRMVSPFLSSVDTT